MIHFSGHGSIASGKTDLVFQDRHTNESKPVGTDQLTVFLRDRGVRLVVLTACDTSAVPAQGTFAVLAEALVRDGIPAVVASQLPLGNETAVYFVRPLYKELLSSGDIDIAVSEGRIALHEAITVKPGDAKLEWGTFTLYRHMSAKQIFKISKPPEPI